VNDRRTPYGVAGHPDLESLAGYVDRSIAADVRQDVESHLVTCADCRAIVADAAALTEEAAGDVAPARDVAASAPAPPAARSPWWLAGLAAAAAVALGVWIMRPATPGVVPGMQELVAAMEMEPVRLFDARLTGGFRYAPAPPVTRGGTIDDLRPETRIAAAELEQAARQRNDAAGDAALGVSRAFSGDLDGAVQALERAVQREPANPAYQSDLSAVYLARGRRASRAGDFTAALGAADRAVAADARLAEACFNRALALESLERRDDARQAWLACADISGADWETEIRTRAGTSP
jgi:hypothetical protein